MSEGLRSKGSDAAVPRNPARGYARRTVGRSAAGSRKETNGNVLIWNQ